MLDENSFKSPSIFGYGVVAKGALGFLPNAKIYDDACVKAYQHTDGVMIHPASEFDPLQSTLELISPAIAPHNALAQRAQHLISEADFFTAALGRQIWISGTNGKTTTTALSAHLLGTKAVGNIGVSMGAAINDRLVVVEMSSFALHYTTCAAPEIYALLDITPDHLSWHKDFAAYLEAKLSPLKRMVPGSLAILPAWLSGRFSTRARVVYYCSENDLAKAFGFDINRIYARFSGILALDAALAASIATAVQGSFSDELLASFKVAPHRCAMFKAGSLDFCDDSKATNADAAICCVKGLKRAGFSHVHLIAGGDAKGQDMSAFAQALGKNVSIYAIGASDFSAEFGEICRGWGDMRWAVSAAIAAAKSGEVIALSPACASLDQYRSYAHRGDEFVNIVREICRD